MCHSHSLQFLAFFSLYLFYVGMLFQSLDQWRNITSNRFVLNKVQGHHPHFRSCPALFHNFWQFIVKVAAAHHPTTQNEVNELLSKGAVEPCSAGAGFCSSVFVIPKHTGGLWPIFSLKQFNYYLHIPSFKYLLSDTSGSSFSVVIMLSPLISRMLFIYSYC